MPPTSTVRSNWTRKDAGVVVLGAGPGGAAATLALGRLGVGRVVLVDRHDFPRDKTCGSGLSPRGIDALKELGIWDEVRREAYSITGIRLVTPGDRELYASGGDENAAVVCKRRVFDDLVVRRARDLGAEFIPHYNAKSLIEEGGRVCGITDGEGREIRARYTLVAGGSHCAFGPAADRGDERMIQAIMGWWQGVSFRPHHIEMIFDRMVAPLYGWLFPESDGVVNIGIAYEEEERGRQNARQLFQRFLDKHYRDRLKGCPQIGAFKGHPVVWRARVRRLTAPGCFVIGESGRLTHPATAEGIYQAMRSGMMAAAAIGDVFHRGVAERTAAERYDRGCVRAFQASFMAGLAFRAALRTPVLDWLVAAAHVPHVQRLTATVLARM